MKFKDIVEQKDDALKLLEASLKKEFSDLWIQARSGQLRKTAQLGNVRRDIARVLTAKSLRLKKDKT